MRKILLLLKGHPFPCCLAKGVGFSWKFCVPVHSWRFLQDPVQNIWETIRHPENSLPCCFQVPSNAFLLCYAQSF